MKNRSASLAAKASEASAPSGPVLRVAKAPRSRELVIADIVAIVDRRPVLRIDGRIVHDCTALVDVDARDVGRRAAVQFERGNSERPVVLGLVRDPTREEAKPPASLTIQCTREIALRCGEASIVLGADGKIVISGAHVVSRSTGVNRVNGASVQIN